MSSFENPDGTFFAESSGSPVATANPASGDTVKMKYSSRALYVTNSVTLATLTVELPGGVQPGEMVELAFEGTVTALTIKTSTGGAVADAPTAGAAHSAILMRYVNTTVGWVHWK